MSYTAQQIGELVKKTRLALTSGTGLRFIIELERGKPTCQLEKALTVLHTLGIKMELTPPAAGKG
jgi:hypothetical protein